MRAVRHAGHAEPAAFADLHVVGGRLEHSRGEHPARSSSSPAAAETAWPPICSDRAPPVPPPLRDDVVSDCT